MRDFMIVALLAPLAACDGPGAAAPSASGAAAGPGASETRMVDASFVFGRARSDRGAEVRFAGRLEERDGGTFACVALAHNAEPIAKVAAAATTTTEMRAAETRAAAELTMLAAACSDANGGKGVAAAQDLRQECGPQLQRAAAR